MLYQQLKRILPLKLSVLQIGLLADIWFDDT